MGQNWAKKKAGTGSTTPALRLSSILYSFRPARVEGGSIPEKKFLQRFGQTIPHQFWLQFFGHLDDRPDDGFVEGVVQGINVFVAAPFGAQGDLVGDFVAIPGIPQEFFGAK